MLPQRDSSGEIIKIQNEVFNIRRYINTGDGSGTKRHIAMNGISINYTKLRPASPIMEDYQDDIDGG